MFPITSSWWQAKQLFFQKGLEKMRCVNQTFGASSFSSFVLQWSGCGCTGMRYGCCLWYSRSWACGLCWYTPVSSSQPVVHRYWQRMSSPTLQPRVVLFLGEGLRKCLDDLWCKIITIKEGHSQGFYVPGNFVELQYLSTWQLCSFLMPNLQRKS